jgi:ABC-type Fe3+ transport system permease subunit
MLLMLFVLLSVPLGGFCAWFAYRAYKVGRRSTAVTFTGLALACLVTAGLVGGFAVMVLHHS